MSVTVPEVLAVVGAQPQTIGELGLAVLAARGVVRDPSDPAPVGVWLAAQGVSLSALQKLVDGLVNGAEVVEVRGRQLWERGLPTEGTKAGGRYYLLPG